jgi:16S rRNA (uracil1498-N3)-methyltransferase
LAVAPLGDRPLALIIGPEGGLDRAEVEALIAKGATPVTLGRLILRTETAALAALSVLRHLDGELG